MALGVSDSAVPLEPLFGELMTVALASTSTLSSTRQEPLRVMVVDDSVVIRGLISRWVGSEPDMVVAASLRT
jgi:two-component system, chemotaxis family, protein-glutamate methylesterase/glutaminase